MLRFMYVMKCRWAFFLLFFLNKKKISLAFSQRCLICTRKKKAAQKQLPKRKRKRERQRGSADTSGFLCSVQPDNCRSTTVPHSTHSRISQQALQASLNKSRSLTRGEFHTVERLRSPLTSTLLNIWLFVKFQMAPFFIFLQLFATFYSRETICGLKKMPSVSFFSCLHTPTPSPLK